MPTWRSAIAAVPPARPYKRLDKANVEVGVLILESWQLGRLRHEKFYGLGGRDAHMP